jgi:hypothetical protein
MNRRTFLALLGPLAALAGSVRAQRPPRVGRPGQPLRPGRFYESGMNYAPAAGVFKVDKVDTRENILRLSDGDGRSADVYVNPRMFDLSTLKPGDQVAVDFFVPGDNDDRIEAASIFKLEPPS